jgi:NAD+ kinase
LSAHGSILPITSNLLALTPISAFRPRRWKGALIPHTSVVKIDILESEKRPVSVVADNLEIRDIMSVKIFEDRKTELLMLFDPETRLEDKILDEQFID